MRMPCITTKVSISMSCFAATWWCCEGCLLFPQIGTINRQNYKHSDKQRHAQIEVMTSVVDYGLKHFSIKEVKSRNVRRRKRRKEYRTKQERVSRIKDHYKTNTSTNTHTHTRARARARVCVCVCMCVCVCLCSSFSKSISNSDCTSLNC